MPMVDRQPRDQRLQIEPSWTGRSRIDDQPAAVALDERLVRVAIHEDVGRVGRQELRWRRTTQLISVADVNRHPARLECEALRQPPVQRIDVAVHRLDGRDRPEGVQHGTPTHVSGMQNLRDASERLKQAVTQETMRV